MENRAGEIPMLYNLLIFYFGPCLKIDTWEFQLNSESFAENMTLFHLLKHMKIVLLEMSEVDIQYYNLRL